MGSGWRGPGVEHGGARVVSCRLEFSLFGVMVENDVCKIMHW